MDLIIKKSIVCKIKYEEKEQLDILHVMHMCFKNLGWEIMFFFEKETSFTVHTNKCGS